MADVWYCLMLLVAGFTILDSIKFPNLHSWGITEGYLRMFMEGSAYAKEVPRDSPSLLTEYDFIIIGAGSAGCVLARRVSEVRQWNVLLLEAGDTENILLDIPLIAPFLQYTNFNWKYRNEPTHSVCQAMRDRRCHYPRGKGMGGSSAINFMIFTRGNRANYDGWEAMGNIGWSYENVLPYFRKLENILIPSLSENTKYRSKSGPIPVTYAPFRTPLADAFVDAGIQLGFQEVPDYNAETQTGFSYLQTFTKNGTRWSASRAYINPVSQRNNLHFRTRSLVTKILIDPVSLVAYGVEFISRNKKYVVKARKEVIVSAGAIGAPQLLMLSGIGPKEHLNEKKINVIKDLKVGYNLMEHPGFVGATFLVNQSVGILEDEVIDNGNLTEYLLTHKGPFSVPSGVEAIAFHDSRNPTSADGVPDLEILFLSLGIPSVRNFYDILGVREDVFNAVYRDVLMRHNYLLVPLLLKPKSRGRVVLRDRNPYHAPLIYHDFFEDERDVDMMMLGVKLMLQLSNTKAFRRYGSHLHDKPFPECKDKVFASDSYWRCALRQMTIGIWHLSGTCKMGPATDPNAVVDPRLRVYGIKHLRVVDASIIPVVPAAHLHVPTVMIAEKASDLIKEDWRII